MHGQTLLLTPKGEKCWVGATNVADRLKNGWRLPRAVRDKPSKLKSGGTLKAHTKRNTVDG